uniref:dTMP kinase n=1 Tax=Sus scrofa TaxID=9823 RepID=A0A8D0TJI8_PIG
NWQAPGFLLGKEKRGGGSLRAPAFLRKPLGTRVNTLPLAALPLWCLLRSQWTQVLFLNGVESDAGGGTFTRPLIKEKLSQGITLVVDRYAFSGVAFTSAKENFSLDWCKQPDAGLPKPDLVVFLELQLAEAAARGGFGLERYESGAFQQRALQRFQQLMGDVTLPWKTVDASRSIEDVHGEIRALSEDTIQAAAQKPLGELWT